MVLKSHLDRLGLTVGRFAELIGVNRNTVGRWLSGERGIPKVVLLYLELVQPDQVNERAIRQIEGTRSSSAGGQIGPSRALAERILSIDTVVQSTSALMQQLLWLLLSKRVFEKSELIAAI